MLITVIAIAYHKVNYSVNRCGESCITPLFSYIQLISITRLKSFVPVSLTMKIERGLQNSGFFRFIMHICTCFVFQSVKCSFNFQKL